MIRESIDGFPTSYYLDRFDSSKWRVFNLPEGGKVVLTAKGQNLFKFNLELWRVINQYKKDATLAGLSKPLVRKWFKAGGNSDVYEVGDYPLLVKEASTAHSVWSALDRMDHLFWICEEKLPPHISVPTHYGIFDSPNIRRQYLLMQKINAGLTVADIDNGFAVDPSLKDQILGEFDRAEGLILNAAKGYEARDNWPINLLPDWEKNNVVVDLDRPAGAYPFSLWIIDQ